MKVKCISLQCIEHFYLHAIGCTCQSISTQNLLIDVVLYLFIYSCHYFSRDLVLGLVSYFQKIVLVNCQFQILFLVYQ